MYHWKWNVLHQKLRFQNLQITATCGFGGVADPLNRTLQSIHPQKFSTKCMKFKDLFCIFIVENDKFYVKNYNFRSL